RHSFKGCSSRDLTKVEKAKRNATKVQSSDKVNVVGKDDEGRHSIFVRGGISMGRGGASIRGRGRFNRRGGFNGVQISNDKKYVLVKNDGKEKASVSEEKQKQDKNKGERSASDSQVKFIAQRDFKTKNRFSALADENGEESNDGRVLRLILMLPVIWDFQLIKKK
ncbi:hypothetical protein Tco_0244951, partial [Tanacetum coccineum]